MSLKQLILAMITLMLVASAYAWPSVTQVGLWLMDTLLALVVDHSTSL